MFKGLSLRFREFLHKVRKGDEADGGIDPERPAGAQGSVQERETQGQRETANPKEEGGRSHGDGTDAVREDFRYEDPGHRAQRHSVAGDGAHAQDDHEDAAYLEEIAAPQNQIDSGQAASPHQHQGAPAQFLHGEESHEGEDQVGNAGDDDIDEGIVHVIPRPLEDLLGVVENDVRSAPLLEESDDDAQDQHSSERFGQQQFETAFFRLFLGGLSGSDGSQFSQRIVPTSNLGKGCLRPVILLLQRFVSGTFRNQE